MRAFLAGIGLAAVLAGGALAQAPDDKSAPPASSSGCAVGKAKARAYALVTGDFGKDILIQTMLPGVLEAGTLQEEAIRKASRACDRGTFIFNGQSYHLYGDGVGNPGLWAVREDGDGDFAYLARRNADDLTEGWVLVVQRGDVASMMVGFDALPDDDLARRAFAQGLDGRMPTVVTRDMKTGDSTIVVSMPPEEKTPKSNPEMPRPAPGTGAGSKVIQEADGTVFKAGPDGAMIHSLTGFACPTAVAGFPRDRGIIFDAADGGRDVACRFNDNGRSWITLYLTRYPASYTGESVFATYVEQAQDAAPSKGEVAAPIPAGPPPGPGYAAFWKGSKGKIEGLWMVQIDQWHIKLRVTYDPEDEARIKALGAELLRRISEQVKSPEV